MKKVFSSNAQVAHVWASQSQNEGRGNNVFFRDTEIYSYGSHYLAGKIYTKGKKFALINDYNYSNSTAKHLSLIHGALAGRMPYFLVSAKAIRDTKLAVKEMDAKAFKSIQYQLKRVKITDQDSIELGLGTIKTDFEIANDLRALLGLKKIKPNKKGLNKVKKHLQARLDRYSELHTPEMIAKKEALRLKKAEKKQQDRLELQKVNIERFKNGEVSQVFDLPFELLRVKGNEIETSRGAKVPFQDAVKLYLAVNNGMDVIGANCGSFTVDSVTDTGNDKVVKIGCHKILLSEAGRVISEGISQKAS